LEKLIEQYLGYLKMRGCSPLSISIYQGKLKILAAEYQKLSENGFVIDVTRRRIEK